VRPFPAGRSPEFSGRFSALVSHSRAFSVTSMHRIPNTIPMRFTATFRALACGTLALSPCLLSAQAARASGDTTYDIVIRNGRVLDGEGNPWIAADVAITNGHFVKIGKVLGHGRKEIDATGKYVSPGWIDMMDQSGSVLPRNGMAENKLQEGVTTAIGGEGGTPVPAGQVGDYFNRLEKQGI